MCFKRLLLLLSILFLIFSAPSGCASRNLEQEPAALPADEQIIVDFKEETATTALPTAQPTPTPDPADLAARQASGLALSMNMLRVVKNHYYNVLDGALAEDGDIAPLLYQMLDFVYGDSVLDTFTGCFGDEAEYMTHLKDLGYSNINVFPGEDGLVAGATYNGSERVLAAKFDPEREAASLEVYQDDALIRLYEWRAVDGGYAVQFAKALPKAEDPDDEAVSDIPSGIEAEFMGYRAYLMSDATGVVCSGFYCVGELKSIYDYAEVEEAFIHRDMFSYYTFTLTADTVTVRFNGEEKVHVIGDIPDPENDDAEHGDD